jgi:putative glutamine amidotransferase
MKPVILITNGYAVDPNNFGVGRYIRIKENYVNAILRAGGVPVLSAHGDADTYARIADGVLFSGGSDINPIHYGEKPYKEDCHYMDDRDEMELAICKSFYELKKPMLGVCRGIQTINVALGGTLVQDIPSMVELSAHSQRLFDKPAHYVKSTPGSKMRELFGEEFIVNTHHHQSVKDCAPGLRATVLTDEGVIEAVEHESLPIIAAQWHPERMIGEENFEMENMMPLFEYFVELCRKQAEGK